MSTTNVSYAKRVTKKEQARLEREERHEQEAWVAQVKAALELECNGPIDPTLVDPTHDTYFQDEESTSWYPGTGSLESKWALVGIRNPDSLQVPHGTPGVMDAL